MTELEIFILIAVVISVPILIGLLIYVTYKSHIKTIEYDQYLLTDKKLLQLIAEQPGGLISPKQLSDITPLNKKQSKARAQSKNTQTSLRQLLQVLLFTQKPHRYSSRTCIIRQTFPDSRRYFDTFQTSQSSIDNPRCLY